VSYGKRDFGLQRQRSGQPDRETAEVQCRLDCRSDIAGSNVSTLVSEVTTVESPPYSIERPRHRGQSLRQHRMPVPWGFRRCLGSSRSDGDEDMRRNAQPNQIDRMFSAILQRADV
jgi:hypothetical protein